MIKRFLRNIIGLLVAFTAFYGGAHAQSGTDIAAQSWTDIVAQSWTDIVAQSAGAKVYWHAWGGSPVVNEYISWASEQVDELYDIELVHVKIADTANVVKSIQAEKRAGRVQDGKVDLVWINGENFHQMKRERLLLDQITDNLPATKFINLSDYAYDFSVPVDGLEAPWGRARLIFMHDSALVKSPPKTLRAFYEYAKMNPGRITYPAPPDFTGTTMLKQFLLSIGDGSSVFQEPPGDNAKKMLKPLWAFLNKLHPHMWRQGLEFPANEDKMRFMLDNAEIDIGMSYNVGAAGAAIKQGLLAPSVRSYVLKEGTIGNAHYLAIPFNAANAGAAKVVIDFLLSPTAQARKQHPHHWGDPSVLDPDLMDDATRDIFAQLPNDPAVLDQTQLGRALAEPHAQWVALIEKLWLEKYQN